MKIQKKTLSNFSEFSIKNLISITGGTGVGDGDIIIDKNKNKRPGSQG